MYKTFFAFLYILLCQSLSAAHISYSSSSSDSIIIPGESQMNEKQEVTICISPAAVNKQAHGTPGVVSTVLNRRCARYESFMQCFPKIAAQYPPSCTLGIVLLMEKEACPDIETVLRYSESEKRAMKRAEQLCIGNSDYIFHNLFWIESELTASGGPEHLQDEASMKARLSESPCGELNSTALRFKQAQENFFRILQGIKDNATAEAAVGKLNLQDCKKTFEDYSKTLETFHRMHPLRLPQSKAMPGLVIFEYSRFSGECRRIMDADYYSSEALRERLIQISKEIAGE